MLDRILHLAATMVVQIADASYRTWKQQLSPVSQSK